MNSQKPVLIALIVVTCLLAITRAVYHAQALVAPARPASEKSQSPDSGMLLASIHNSGSTNTLPYTLQIFENGGAVFDVQGKPPKDFPAGTVNSQTLKSLLQQVGDVSVLTGGRCIRSVSFGSITQIAYNGKTSGDISCTSGTAWPKAGYDLASFINDLKAKLKIESALGRNH